MYPTGNLFIPVGHGELEGILKEPRVRPARGAALVLHPLPTAGGTMHSKVVFHAASALNEAGIATLRFNFRGVGQSTGTHDHGSGELDDARAALDYLGSKYPILPITICGFSFGALIGLDVGIVDERVTSLISIGTPIDKYDFGFVETCRKPILFIHGDADEFGNLSRLQGLVKKVKENGPAQISVISGANHFFEGRLPVMKNAIVVWMGQQN